MKRLSVLAAAAIGAGLAMPAHAADAGGSGFVALDICNAMGVAGLTLASDDTCLLISGEVEYEYEFEIDGETGDEDISSEVDWELAFEAMTRTDAGTASAVVVLAPEDPADRASTIEITEAYVSFGDTTLLTAGLTSSIFEVSDEQLILDDIEVDEIDDSHVVQLVSVMDNGTYFGIGAEDLDDEGALGAFVGYDKDGLTANLGAFVYNLYDVLDTGADAEWNLYGDILAEYDSTELFAAFVAAHDRFEAVSSIGVDIDDLFLKAALGAAYDEPADAWSYALGLGFEVDIYDFELRLLTEEWDDLGIEAELVAELTDDLEVELAVEFEDVHTDSDAEGTLTLTVALTETLEAEAWVGLAYEAAAARTIYGAGGELTYEPGGDFEIAASLEGWSNGDMALGFSTAKEF